MCDYSLQYVASRPAKVGDKLVSTKFSNSITGGFAAVGEPNVAVCLLPGTEVAFEKEVECEHAPGFFSNWMPGKRLKEKVARFRQVEQEQHVHHDALEFPSGQIVLAHLFSVTVSTRLCCNCQMRRARRRKRRSKSALLSSLNRVRRGGVVGEIEVVAEAERKPH